MGPFGSDITTDNFVPSGVPVIRGGNLTAGRFRAENFVFLSDEKADRLAGANAYPGDVVFTHRGTLGQVGLIPDTPFQRYVISQSQMKVTCRTSEADPAFFYYFFKSPLGQHALLTNTSQTGVPAISRPVTSLKSIRLSLPPLPEQHSIAHILGTLDDKMELNRGMNETLESMARALFKSWFVDFDPVHAKAALKHHAANPIPRRGDSIRATKATPSDHSPLGGESARQGRPPAGEPEGGIRRRYTYNSRKPAKTRCAGEPEGGIRRRYSARTLQRAQTLRDNRTDAEGLLWQYLRNKQLGGYKFRRQQPMGPYIADFACLPEKLLVELDGGQHAARQAHDDRRDAFLREKGYRALRFWNNEVFDNCFGVLDRVYAALTDPPPQQPVSGGLAVAASAQEGTHWTVERARAYLDGMEPEIAALFPDRFVSSESGRMIPEGWKETRLDGIALLNPEAWTARNAPESIVYVDLSNTKWGTIEKYETHGWQEAPSRAKRVLRTGDTILGTVRPGNGSYAFIGQDGLTGSTGFAVLRPVLPRDRALVWGCATAPENIRRLTHVADGAAYPAVRPRVVSATGITLPSGRIRDAFGKVCGPLLDRMEATKRESCALAALRDTLLPELVSGRMRIPEPEQPGSSGRRGGRVSRRSV